MYQKPSPGTTHHPGIARYRARAAAREALGAEYPRPLRPFTARDAADHRRSLGTALAPGAPLPARRSLGRLRAALTERTSW